MAVARAEFRVSADTSLLYCAASGSGVSGLGMGIKLRTMTYRMGMRKRLSMVETIIPPQDGGADGVASRAAGAGGEDQRQYSEDEGEPKS